MSRPEPKSLLRMTADLAEEICRYLRVRTKDSDLASTACLLAAVTLHLRAMGTLRPDEDSARRIVRCLHSAILAIDEEVADAV